MKTRKRSILILVANSTSGKTSYWKSLKWVSIPASVGFAYIAYLQFRHIQKRERRQIAKGDPQSLVLETWQVSCSFEFICKEFNFYLLFFVGFLLAACKLCLLYP